VDFNIKATDITFLNKVPVYIFKKTVFLDDERNTKVSFDGIIKNNRIYWDTPTFKVMVVLLMFAYILLELEAR